LTRFAAGRPLSVEVDRPERKKAIDKVMILK
jgi:hypothetical protein